MSNESKRQFVDEYNAAETLHDNNLIDDTVYDVINNKILRTIISHFAIELLNKEEKKDE